MIIGLIGNLITGLIIGFGGRAILPGGQDIGLPKTVGLGVVASILVGLVASGAGWLTSIILGSIVAAGLLWVAIKQGWLTSTSK